MLTVADLVAQLPETEHVALANGLGGGLHNARLAAQCLTDPQAGLGQTENVAQMAAYLTATIAHLQAARGIVQRYG